MHGSSPHGRGTPGGYASALGQDRFIPARAGNTPHPRSARRAVPVHPRTGGEHCPLARSHRPVGGSSPHGRGTRLDLRDLRADRRFIPARAGNTHSASTAAAGLTVHPRTGGEHVFCVAAIISCIGSSPHGRGTPVCRSIGHDNLRFIPARAGNTTSHHSYICPNTVHPRTGGEHSCCSSLNYRAVSQLAIATNFFELRTTLFSALSKSTSWVQTRPV